VNHLTRLVEANPMPDAAGYNDRLTGPQRYFASGLGVFEDHRHGTGYQEQNLISVWMHLAVVRRLLGENWSANRVAVDSLRWTRRAHLGCSTTVTPQMNDGC
jgi:hypothetical protein